MGVSKRLKKHNPKIQIIGVEPENGTSIQGLKNLETQYVPAIWKETSVDEIHKVHPKKAEEAGILDLVEEHKQHAYRKNIKLQELINHIHAVIDNQKIDSQNLVDLDDNFVKLS